MLAIKSWNKNTVLDDMMKRHPGIKAVLKQQQEVKEIVKEFKMKQKLIV